VFKHSDEMLYQAKRHGRNRVEVFRPARADAEASAWTVLHAVHPGGTLSQRSDALCQLLRWEASELLCLAGSGGRPVGWVLRLQSSNI